MATADYTCRCDGSCGDESPHDSHLTPAGEAHYIGVEPEKNIFKDSESVEQLLGELAGYSSVCWQQQVKEEGKYGRPDTYERVFDSERAQLGVEHALLRLGELQKENI